MKRSGQYMVRNYRKGDEEGITALFREIFKKEMTGEQWHWKYAVPGKGRVYSKVAEDTSRKIIAHAGAIPLKGAYENKPMQFFQIVDVMVHPKARGSLGRKGVFEHLMKTLFDDLQKEFPEVFCYGFPGGRPFLLGKRVRVYDEIERAVDCVRETKRVFWTPFAIKPMDWNDKRLNAAWREFSKNIRLSVIRDSQYLHWRYATNPFFSYHLLGIFLLGKLKGWAIARDSGDEVFIVDLLAESRRYNTVLKAITRYFSSQKKKSMHFWLPRSRRDTITEGRKEETEVVVTNMIWNLPMKTSVVRDALYYTMGDVDIF